MSLQPASSGLWSEEKLTHLQEQLTGCWAEDTWLMVCRVPGKPGSQVQRFFHFAFASSSLVVEFKYALWSHLRRGEWQTPWSQENLFYALRLLVCWLNQTAPATHSLLEKTLEFWVCSLRSWLVQTEHYTPSRGKHLTASQTYTTYPKEDRRIALFRVVYRTLVDVYDDRPETDKEIWDLRKLGLSLNFSQSTHQLNFTVIAQPWLRALAQRYLKYNLAIHSVGDCVSKLTAIRQFSQFLAHVAPQAEASQLDRALMLGYLGFLREQQLAVGTQHNYLVALRIFLDTCAHRLNVPGLSHEPLIFDDDLVKRPEYGTREVPEEVLVQLRAHLHALPTITLRMVTILLEVGLRISELCQLPLDCLICDDKHEWYLRFYQSKTHREHVIPLVEEELVEAIQAQQQDMRAQWGNTCPYLFPSPLVQTKPYHQKTFSYHLNAWALKYEIKDRSEHLYRFTAHQFRHTVGMRLMNEDVPLEVVSRLLGHRSLTMTQVYARVRDQKLRADLERVARKRKTVDYQGNAVKGDSRANDPEVQMTRKGVRGQTLPVGGCGRLVVLGECSYANKCLTCPMWLTSTDDLAALKSFSERSIRLKQRATELGNQIVIKQQDHIIGALAVRIKSLEAPEMGGALCLDDVLAGLRTDLAEAECALEEVQAIGLVLPARHLERAITEIKARVAALEVSV